LLRANAKQRGIEFNLEQSDITPPLVCPILGIPLNLEFERGDRAGPSVDRIDNKSGYVKGNVQVVSLLANRMKQDASPEELLKFAEWILKTYKSANDNDGRTDQRAA
jgi:hypothetical protein